MIGVAVLGYGYWGPNLARCFGELADCHVVAIADPSSDARARAAKRHPYAKMFADWRDVLKEPAVDAVAVATPVATHYELAHASLSSGRHVLVEKPMTESAAEAQQLTDLAAGRQLTLMVGHTFVYSSAIRRIHDLIVAGEMGDIYYYDSTRINLGLFRRDVNVLWDLAIHDLSILQFLFDRMPVAVSATGTSHVRGHRENMAQLTLTYADNLVAHINVNWLAPVKIRQVLIGGSRQMIVYDDLQPSEKIKIYNRGVNLTSDPEEIYRMLVSYRLGDMWAPQLATTEPMITQTQHFIDCIAQGEVPMSDGRLGRDVVAILEAATLSLRRGGRPIELMPSLRKVS